MLLLDAHDLQLQALRAGLSASFEALSHGVTDVAQIKQISDELAKAATQILGELVRAWSVTNNLLLRLPPEVVALCFAFLPFRDRIAVSHVSRHWRDIALMHPAVWEDIDLSDNFRNRPELLYMALSRSGQHPVDLYGCPSPDASGLVALSLVEHMHHLRTIECSPRGHAVRLWLPAPLLKTLKGIHNHVDLPHNLLGGQVASLRTLYMDSVSLPKTCPALSTVTHLSLRGPSDAAFAAPFANLFRLCPVLQSLTLRQLKHASADHLPAGPAPASLTQIRLETMDRPYDLGRHYADWRHSNLSDVDLDQVEPTTPQNLRLLVSGAVELNIGREYSFGRTYIIAFGPGQHRRMVNFADHDEHSADIAEMILGSHKTLSHLRTLEIPSTALEKFLRVLTVLPELAHLALFIKSDSLRLPTHHFGWRSLSSLASLPQHCPGLESLTLNVVCWDVQCSPAARDALDLLARLKALGPCKLPTILVKGFPEVQLRDIDIPAFDTFRVVFDLAVDS